MGSRGNADAARDRFLGGGSERGNGVAAAIHASWVRARATGIRPDRALPPVPLVDDAVLRRRRGHPLAPVWPILRESLRWATCDTGLLLIVSDAEGHLLWCQGDPGPLRQAERVHMLPGALWSEDTVGTTAVSTAIALRRPFQVFGAEHYASFARPFACSAAPIHDPVTGRLLGTVDLTSATDADRALKLSLVTTAARLAEAQLLAERLRHQARLREKYADRLAPAPGRLRRSPRHGRRGRTRVPARVAARAPARHPRGRPGRTAGRPARGRRTPGRGDVLPRRGPHGRRRRAHRALRRPRPGPRPPRHGRPVARAHRPGTANSPRSCWPTTRA
ncbi:GAF domain-containing protein [Yinghuangia aomiensis]